MVHLVSPSSVAHRVPRSNMENWPGGVVRKRPGYSTKKISYVLRMEKRQNDQENINEHPGYLCRELFQQEKKVVKNTKNRQEIGSRGRDRASDRSTANGRTRRRVNRTNTRKKLKSLNSTPDHQRGKPAKLKTLRIRSLGAGSSLSPSIPTPALHPDQENGGGTTPEKQGEAAPSIRSGLLFTRPGTTRPTPRPSRGPGQRCTWSLSARPR